MKAKVVLKCTIFVRSSEKKRGSGNKSVERQIFPIRRKKLHGMFKKHVPVEEGDYYLSPEGYRIFTAQYLLKRGYCCESGCRHCPYGFDKDKLKTQ